MGMKLVERGGYYHMRGTVAGYRIRESTGVKVGLGLKAQAEEVMAGRHRELLEQARTTGKVKTRRGVLLEGAKEKTFKDAQDAYRNYLRREGRLHRKADNLIRRWDIFKSVRLKDLDGEMLLRAYDKHFDNVKPGTLRRYIATLCSILTHAKNEQGWHFTMPNLHRPGNIKDERTVSLSPVQVRDFLEWLKSEGSPYYGHFLAKIYTGARVSELLALTKWDIVKGANGSWVAHVNKTVRTDTPRTKTLPRRVPLPEWVGEDLDQLPELDHTGRIFGGAKGQKVSPETMSSILRDELYQARTVGVASLRRMTDLRPHDMRHTFARLWAEAGADIADLKDLMGHTDLDMTMRYRGFVQPRVSRIAEKVGAVT